MGYLRKMQVLFLMVLAGIMLLSTPAFAQDVRFYDSSVVTGFEPGDYEKTISTEYKYALIELEKEFPAQLTIRLGGEAAYEKNQNGSSVITTVTGYTTQTVDVTWVCRENYDEDMEVFHFIPEFGAYKLAAGLELPEITVNVLGEIIIPPANHFQPLEHRPIAVKEKTLDEKAALPASYNNYTRGALPAIRDQGDYGTCWAHATIAAVEGDLIHDGNATTSIDLSELHLSYFSYHNFTDEKGLNTGDTITGPSGTAYLNNGGHDFLAAGALFNMLGPVKETAAPYSSAATYSPSASAGRKGDYKITGVYYYDITNDSDSVKTAIMNHGAVTAHFLANSSYYSAKYNSFYCPTSSETDHAIAIVGWDDNFSSSKFSSGTPAGNGAWLIRNSWGTNGYGWGGYFWMSYYDKSLYQYGYAYDVQPGGRYDHVYAYDNVPNYGWNPASSGMSQTFYVDGGEAVQAIGYFTEESNLTLKFTVTAGSNSVTKTYTTGAPGYYLIPLSSPMTISSRTKVTVSCTITSGSAWAYHESGLSSYGDYGFTFNAAKGSAGMVVSGSNIGYDGKIKLFTNNASTISSLEINTDKIMGYSNGISLTVPKDENITGYSISVYDMENRVTVKPTIDKPVSSGNQTTIKIHGDVLVNGNIYRIKILKYRTVGSEKIKSNTVTVYAMPNVRVKHLTAQTINKGVIINSTYISGTDGKRYSIYDASTNKKVKHIELTGSNTVGTITGLENGKLYFAKAYTFRIYNNQKCWASESQTLYFVPVPPVSSGNVYFSGKTTAVITAKANSATDGIRTLYRNENGILQEGCEAAANSCTIKNLSQNKGYEFYLMHYIVVNGNKHFSSGVTIKYNPPTLSALSVPQNPKISAGNPTWKFIITRTSNAVGISVLYRVNEGNFTLGCEKAGNSCTIDLSQDQAYTFYIMQYKEVNGQKIYSPGIIVKNVLGTKSIDGDNINIEFIKSDEIVDEFEILNALSGFRTEDDLMEVMDFLSDEMNYDYPEISITDLEFVDDGLITENMSVGFDGLFIIDDFEPTEEDFIDVPMDGAATDSMEQKTLGESAEEESGMIFYGVGDGVEADPYAPSFRNK